MTYARCETPTQEALLALREANPRLWGAYEIHVIRGVKQTECATELGITQAGFNHRIARAHTWLRRYMTGERHEDQMKYRVLAREHRREIAKATVPSLTWAELADALGVDRDAFVAMMRVLRRYPPEHSDYRPTHTPEDGT